MSTTLTLSLDCFSFWQSLVDHGISPLFMLHLLTLLATMHGGPTFWPLNVLVPVRDQKALTVIPNAGACFVWIMIFYLLIYK